MKSFYLAPNRDSFRLTTKSESIEYRVESFYFAPTSDSFKLIKKSESITKEITSTTQVGELTSSESIENAISNTTQVVELTNTEPAHNVKDFDRRKFLKVLGMTGIGFVATSLFPKKADALILGGTPTSSVVGVKNVTNTRINPATEETAASLLKTSDLTFDAGSLQVKVTSQPSGSSSFSDSGDVAKSGLVDADRHVQVDVLSSTLPSSASTETTLQTIAFGGFKYTLRLATVGEVDYVGEAAIGTTTSSASWRIKKVDSASGIIIQWAGSGVFDQVWDNRAILSYS